MGNQQTPHHQPRFSSDLMNGNEYNIASNQSSQYSGRDALRRQQAMQGMNTQHYLNAKLSDDSSSKGLKFVNSNISSDVSSLQDRSQIQSQDIPSPSLFVKFFQTSLPVQFLEKYQISNMNQYMELEKIWEAYKALLIDTELQKVENMMDKEHTYLQDATQEMISQFMRQRSNKDLSLQISPGKLYSEGKNYMNSEEIEAVLGGELREYLSQYDLENNEDYLQYGSVDLQTMMRNNGLPKYNSQTIKPGSQLGESDVQLPDRKAMSMADDKIPYSPESVKYSSMTAYNQSQVKMSQFKVDHEVRTTDCTSGVCSKSCANGAYDSLTARMKQMPRQQQSLGNMTYLSFDDFYWLMKLKISYQRKSVSQVMMQESEKQGKQGPQGIMINRSGDQGSHESNVVVESKQETVSCIFWPFHENRYTRQPINRNTSIPQNMRKRSPKKSLNQYIGGIPKKKNSPIRQRLNKNFKSSHTAQAVKTIKLDREYDFDPKEFIKEHTFHQSDEEQDINMYNQYNYKGALHQISERTSVLEEDQSSSIAARQGLYQKEIKFISLANMDDSNTNNSQMYRERNIPVKSIRLNDSEFYPMSRDQNELDGISNQFALNIQNAVTDARQSMKKPEMQQQNGSANQFKAVSRQGYSTGTHLNYSNMSKTTIEENRGQSVQELEIAMNLDPSKSRFQTTKIY